MKITEKEDININNKRTTVVNIHTELSGGVKIKIASPLCAGKKVTKVELPQNETSTPGRHELRKVLV